MKKWILLLLLVFALGAFAACGGGDGDTVTLRVGESLGYTEDFIREAGRIFTERNPHIRVEFVNVEIGQAHTQVALDGPAGVGPDVFAAPHDQLGSLVAGGLILPARNPAQVQAQALASTVLAASFDGVLYGYPMSAETYAIFYNRDLIDSVPGTFAELFDWTIAFNAANPGRFGFLFEPGNAYYTIIFMSQEGNRLFGPHGTDATTPNVNTPAAISGMEFMRSLRPMLDVPSGDVTTAFVDGAFMAGDVAMLMSGPWNIGNFLSAGINLGVATIPSLPGEVNPPASFSGTRVMFVSAFTHHPDEAHMFAEFLMTEEIQRLRYEITQTIPAAPIETGNPYFGGFMEQLQFAVPMPSIPEMGAFWGAMPAASANIWDGADIVEQLNMTYTAIRN